MTESAAFVRDAHRIVGDLLAPRPSRYWTDFLFTIAAAYVALAIYLSAPPFSIAQILAFVVCGLAMYRAVVFTHELTHRRGRAFVLFGCAWNALCGVPFLMPSFLYGDHEGHHASQVYGTWSDPEYLLRSRRWRLRVILFLLLALAYPLFAVIRFLVLAPLALISRRLDVLVWTRASSLYVMNEAYRREPDRAMAAPARWVQEIACAAWAWTLVALAASGRIPLAAVGKIYLVFLFWIAINQVRTLVAHRYGHDPDATASHLEQLLDTNTYPHGGWLPELWAPVGLRYHALHHLLPLMPYHAMAHGHARLMAELPPGSAYHRTVRRGLWPVLQAMLRDRDRRDAAGSPAAAILTADRPAAR